MVRSRDRFDPIQVFEFVKAHHALWPIVTQCRVLGVSPSGYYAWLKRSPSLHQELDTAIGDHIEAFHEVSLQTYGRPRIQADLRDAGIRTSDKRVARLMRERNIEGASRRKSFITTVRDRDARPAPDLVERNFTADASNKLWVSDITYVPTLSVFLFVAIVLDVLVDVWWAGRWRRICAPRCRSENRGEMAAVSMMGEASWDRP